MANGVFGKFKELVGIDEVDDDFEEMEPIQDKLKKAADRRAAYQQPRIDSKESRVLVMQNQTNPGHMKLFVTEPKSFDDCPKMVDNLKSRKPVIINLEKIESDVARKIFDFLSGATYALDGNVQKVANNIFIFAPNNVDVLAQVDNKDGNSGNPWR